MASFMVNELKQVGIEATLKQIETAQWHPKSTRGEYQIAAEPHRHRHRTTPTPTSSRTPLRLAPELQLLLHRAGDGADPQQSQALDPKKRLALVQEIQKKLEADAARPILDWRLDYLARLAPRQEPGPAPVDLQLRAHAGGLARQVASGPVTRARRGGARASSAARSGAV